MEEALRDFAQVAQLAREPLDEGELEAGYYPAPHMPPSSLLPGFMAVYCFCYSDVWLKIGKAGPKSGPRYTSHHYRTSAPSTLAKSLIADPRMKLVVEFDPEEPREWICAHTNRVNILLPATRNRTLLSLLESFLHARFRPRYEG